MESNRSNINVAQVQYLIGVPKRNIPLAVDRNLIKRRIREALRHERSKLEKVVSDLNKRYVFAVTYVGRKIPEMDVVQSSINEVIQLWMDKHETDKKDSNISIHPTH